jgi:hypothetical protein
VQVAKRLAFAKELTKKYPEDDPYWDRIVFSDETYRGCTDMDQTQWVGQTRNAVM